MHHDFLAIQAFRSWRMVQHGHSLHRPRVINQIGQYGICHQLMAPDVIVTWSSKWKETRTYLKIA